MNKITAREYQTLHKKPKKTIEPLETHLQQLCIKYARNFQHKIICEGTPAQAERKRTGYFRMEAEGYIAGSSDIKVYGKCGKVVFIELKRKGGKHSDHQKEYQKLVESFGYKYHLLYSLNEFMEVLELEFNVK